MNGRRLAVVGGVAGLVLVVTSAVYLRSAFTGDPAGAPTIAAASPSTPALPGARETAPPTLAVELGPAPVTDDPAEFARLAAAAIFAWDTSTGHAVEEYVARLVGIADPTGEETPGLVADLTGYLPTATAWAELRTYATRQWLEVDSVQVPSLWPQAVAQAPEGALLPGSAAYTVTGVRHRAGVWHGDAVTSEHEVAFTIFMVCAPSYDQCHLLRLSRLDEPLD
jgi:hypothetical protein